MSRKHRSRISIFARPLVFAAALAITQVLFHANCVQAQGGKDEEEKTKSWVVPYALVVSCVGLGLLAICRPSQRQEDLPHKDKK